MTDYRIDELALAAGSTVRNVRAYAERGLLPPPRRRGRVNVYDEQHLARLRLIGRLLERGYTTAHISSLMTTWRSGRDLGAALGLEAALVSPASGELAEEVTPEELQAMFGGQPSDELLRRAVGLGLLVPVGGRFRVPNPRMLRAGAELVSLGVPLPEVLDLAEELRGRIAAVAESFVHVVADALLAAHGPDWVPDEAEVPELVALVERLRPLARMTVDTELASALDAGIAEVVAKRVQAAISAAAG